MYVHLDSEKTLFKQFEEFFESAEELTSQRPILQNL